MIDVGRRTVSAVLLALSVFLLGGMGVGAAYPAAKRPATPAGVTRWAHSRPQRLLPAGLSIAGLPVGGLTLEEARAALERYRLDVLRRPLTVYLDGQPYSLDPTAVGLEVDIDKALQQAEPYAEPNWLQPASIYLNLGKEEGPAPVHKDLPLEIRLDAAALRDWLEALARDYDRAPIPMQVLPLSDTAFLETIGVLTTTWAMTPSVAFVSACPGRRLDVESSLPLLEEMLRQYARRPLSLTVALVPPPAPDLRLLQAVLEEQVQRLPGVVGVYGRDLQSGQAFGVNDGAVFSGASVVKIAILLQAYRVLDGPAQGIVAGEMGAMMVWSDNDAANWLLALGGGGDGVRGAQQLTEMLQRLGLQASYLCNPYYGERSWEGCPPAWSSREAEPRADPLLQTTPRDMGRLLEDIYACALGRGPILETFPGEITSEECRAMLGWMGQNDDLERMVAGLPQGIAVAHKSGWISDMKADAGIVFSPGGDYILSVFVWEEGELPDWEGNPRIAYLSWIVYAFFNPL